MRIRRCDRCGVPYDPKSLTIDKLSVNAVKTGEKNMDNYFASGKTYDLCPDCLFSLKRWLNNEVGK